MSSDGTITVIVKAANGSLEDFRMDAGPQWRIKELKNHLYRHYPSHPPFNSQKLIYGGKLLLDEQTIEEIVPEPKDSQVVFHLVAYERSASAPAMLLPTTMSRQPSLAPVEETSRQPSAASLEETDAHDDTAVTPPQPETQQPAAVPVAANQPQTPNPWLRYRLTPYAQRFPAVSPVQNFPAFVPGNMPTYPFPQFYMSPYGAAYATQIAQWYYNYYGRLPPGRGGGGGGMESNGDEGGGDILDLPNPQDLPNEQDFQQEVAVNAGGFGMMGGGNFQPMPRRDLVDYVYKFMMAGFLVAMAYITGSVGRLLIFVGGLLFMLLNQAGWFAVQRRRQANQPGVVEEPAPPNERPPPQDSEGEEEGEENEGEHQLPNNLEGSEGDSGDENEPADDEPLGQDNTHPPLPPVAPARPGLLATIFVFVTSFFTSLIPRQQPEPLMN